MFGRPGLNDLSASAWCTGRYQPGWKLIAADAPGERPAPWPLPVEGANIGAIDFPMPKKTHTRPLLPALHRKNCLTGKRESLDVHSHNIRSPGANLGPTILRTGTGVDRFAPARPPSPLRFPFSQFGNQLRRPSTFLLISSLHLRYYGSTLVICKIIDVL